MPQALTRGDLLPEIRTDLPGPRSSALAHDLARSEAPGINTLGGADEPAIVWRAACGANVLDVDGNRFVDLTSGFGAAAIGHRHPRIVEAVVQQATELLHGLGDVAAHPARIALARKLCQLAPIDSPRVHFAVSGADAVEIAWKTALLASGRQRLLAFDPGYHGLSLGALAATSRREFRAPFAAQLSPHVDRLPFACPLELVEKQLAAGFGAGVGAVAAVIVEPIVGREGILVPPAGWLAGLSRLCREAGAALILDEILTGFGRTGSLFACDLEAVRPDLLCCGKALGGGLPLAAVVGRAELMAAWRTGGEALHTGTFVAHPLACAAALATLEVIAAEKLIARAAGLGRTVHAALAPALPAGVALRGRGALWGLELPEAAAAARFVAALRRRGLLVLRGGPSGRVVELLPPLVITEEQLTFALAAIVAALDELEALLVVIPARLKLAFIGSHGVGKTTLCYGLAARLKRRDVALEIVHEVARRSPLPINATTTADAQRWILHTQIAEEIFATARYPFVLCDRSVLDNYIYYLLAAGPDPTLDRLVSDWLASYDLLVQVPILAAPQADGIRAADPSFQRAVDDRLRAEVALRGVATFELEAARSADWLDLVEAEVLRRLRPAQLELL